MTDTPTQALPPLPGAGSAGVTASAAADDGTVARPAEVTQVPAAELVGTPLTGPIPGFPGPNGGRHARRAVPVDAGPPAPQLDGIAAAPEPGVPTGLASGAPMSLAKTVAPPTWAAVELPAQESGAVGQAPDPARGHAPDGGPEIDAGAWSDRTWPPPPRETRAVGAPATSRASEVACPSCGTTSFLDLDQRASTGFCRVCDYPLFWAVERVLPTEDSPTEGSLRRLPGTAGRTALASVPCPVCTEPNRAVALICQRCGSDMRPTAPVAPPAPVAIPAAVVEPEPLARPWWPWALFVAGVLAIVALVVLLATL